MAMPKSTAPNAASYLRMYRASPIERIGLIKQGVSAAMVKALVADLAIGQGAGLRALNLSTATINKKAKLHQSLSPGDSERVIGCARLVGQLEAMIEESGDPTSDALRDFNAAAWMAHWLNEPLPALGGARPIDFMDTMEGQALVSSALAKVQTGAYA